MTQKTYPAECDRSSCSHAQEKHDPSVNTQHPCLEANCSCSAYIFPPGVSSYYPVLGPCQRPTCGEGPDTHALTAPHARGPNDPPACEGYVFGAEDAEGSYTGGGGGFGGGGASGGW